MTKAEETTESNTTLALCVDLDGTLISGDIAWQCVLGTLRSQPLRLLRLPFWLMRGRQYAKSKLAHCVPPAVSQLRYRPALMEFIRTERESGRPIVLVTGCDASVAERISAHLGLFDAVYGSTAERNLVGKAKAELLTQLFGELGFDYVGDSLADLPVWAVARAGYVVGDDVLAARAARVTQVERVFKP